MMYISFTDFPSGWDCLNNLFSNALSYVFDEDICIVDPSEADICFVTIYGNTHPEVLANYHARSLLWLGENIRPNKFNCAFSISTDPFSYSFTNFRLPLWFFEIDWFDSGIGTASKQQVLDILVNGIYANHIPMQARDFCVTIFNNPEGFRLELLSQLNQIGSVTGYGRPFGNWFDTSSSYKSKIPLIEKYKFNLCPENSLFPGYYTEKCFHAKLAGSIPIYFADSHVSSDFNVKSFLNAYDYHDLSELMSVVNSLSQNPESADIYSRQPLLHCMPSLDLFLDFMRYAVASILSNRIRLI